MVRSILTFAVGLLAVALAPAAVQGHGMLVEPAARNVLTNYNYCPQCLSAGGPYEVSAQGSLTWPAGVHGTCGDAGTGGPMDVPGAVAATYQEGSTITISLVITARHGGRHVFRICDRANADETCLSAHTLQRADGAGPYLWMQRSGGPANGGTYGTGTSNGYTGEKYSVQYQLPAGLTCERCVLQWWWTTGNSCDVPGTPYGPTGMLSCTSVGPYPEEFWNCADISIIGTGGGGKASADPVLAPAKPVASSPEAAAPAPARHASPKPTATADGPEKTAKPTPAKSPTIPTPMAKSPKSPKPRKPAAKPPVKAAAPSPGGRRAVPGGSSSPKPGINAAPMAAADPAAVCAAHGGTGYYVLPGSACHQFVQCAGGQGHVLSCPGALLWDDVAKACSNPGSTTCAQP